MINPEARISLKTQSELLKVPRSSLYYEARENSDDMAIMNAIHELWLKYPFYGYRRITAALNKSGHRINHKRTLRLMRSMKLQAIYPKCTTMANKEHQIYPYLLSGLEVQGPNHVWATDLTYIKMRTGFVYLVALIDLSSRYIVSWQMSVSMEVEFCMEMLEGALKQNRPQIVNTDQGSQFTSSAWINLLKEHGIKISMDSKGRCLDNVYIERFWRSLKQEEVYLKPYDSVLEAREGIGHYIEFYNNHRLHQSLDYKTPAEVYFARSSDRCCTEAAVRQQVQPMRYHHDAVS